MTDEQRRCLEVRARWGLNEFELQGASLKLSDCRAIAAALTEIERLRAELAGLREDHAELRRWANESLTVAARSVGIDPDGMDDEMVLRAIIAAAKPTTKAASVGSITVVRDGNGEPCPACKATATRRVEAVPAHVRCLHCGNAWEPGP